mgnify:CR=1 FL=1
MTDKAQKVSALKAAFGTLELSRDGDDVSVKCPKCAKPGSTKKKLVINLEKGMYHCWVCGMKGRNVLRVVRMVSPSAADLPIFKKWGKVSKSRLDDDDQVVAEEKLKIPKGFRLLGDNFSARDPDIRAAIKYCRSRGLTEREIWRYRLGTCTTSQFRRRVIVPSFDDEGNLNYYSARSIDPENKFKYLNAKVSKKDIIFNELNIDWKSELSLVEGPFDLMKVRSNAGCLLGSHLPTDSLLFRRIVKMQTPVLLSLDDDAIHKMHKIAKELTSYGVKVRYVTLPPDRDVGDMALGEFEDVTKKARAWHSNHRLFSKIGEIRSGSLI